MKLQQINESMVQTVLKHVFTLLISVCLSYILRRVAKKNNDEYVVEMDCPPCDNKTQKMVVRHLHAAAVQYATYLREELIQKHGAFLIIFHFADKIDADDFHYKLEQLRQRIVAKISKTDKCDGNDA